MYIYLFVLCVCYERRVSETFVTPLLDSLVHIQIYHLTLSTIHLNFSALEAFRCFTNFYCVALLATY